MSCLTDVRVISMIWIYLLHPSVLFSVAQAATTEPTTPEEEDPFKASIPCPGIPSWHQCPHPGGFPYPTQSQSGYCISPSQLCDGQIDCLDNGWDESAEVCARRRCQVGVRCQESHVCLRVPHRNVCNGEYKKSLVMPARFLLGYGARMLVFYIYLGDE
jgi:hypothetical protein